MKKSILFFNCIIFLFFIISCGNNKQQNNGAENEIEIDGIIEGDQHDEYNEDENAEWENDAKIMIKTIEEMTEFLIKASEDSLFDEGEIKVIKNYSALMENISMKYADDYLFESKFIEYIEEKGAEATLHYEDVVYSLVNVEGFDKIINYAHEE